jgi:KDO2-lipid IV(A) lauroyltransferase
MALGLLWCTTRLPFALQLAIGRGLGRLAWLLAPDRRQIALTNLTLCFPELTAVQRRRLLADHFASLGIALIETAMSWWAPARRLAPLVSIRGLEHLQDALQSGRTVILLSAHFTTLEIGGRLLSLYTPFHVLYRTHKNPVIEAVMQRARTRLYEKAIPRGDLLAMLRSLKQQRPVWYAPDQDFGAGNSVFVPFFGVPAATLTATSRLARAAGACVIPFFPVRLPGTRGYELHLLPALQDFPGDDIEQDTVRITGVIENHIRLHPEQYLWVHRRFKTRPPGESPLYPRRNAA